MAGYAALTLVSSVWRQTAARAELSREPPHHGLSEASHAKEPTRTGPATSAVDAGWWSIVKAAALQWVDHKDARLGAALSYYSVFSIGPLIVIAVAIAGLLFGQEAVSGEVTQGLKGLLGETGARAIEAMLTDASKPRQGIIATVIGVGTLIFAAVGVVVQLKDALNTVWEAKAPSGQGLWSYARTYILSLAGVLSLGFLLLTSMLVTTTLSAMGKLLVPFLPETTYIAGREFPRIVRRHKPIVRDDVQVAARRSYSMARCLDWCGCNCGAVRDRKASYWPVHRQARLGINVWGGSVNCCRTNLGLLFGSDRVVRC
jgi:hypothetical protein